MSKEEINILKVEDIQEIMGIGRDKAYRLMHSDGFPSVQIGKTFFVTVDNFMRWMRDYTYKEYKL